DLATQPRGVRPTEVLAVVAPELEVGLVRRTHQWIERDGARCEPLLWHASATTDAHEKGSPCPTRTTTSLSTTTRPPLDPPMARLESDAGAAPAGAVAAAVAAGVRTA